MSTELDEPWTHADADPAPAGVDMVTHLWLGPDGLDGFLRSVEDRRRPLIKYRDGSLTLVSPSPKHERGGDRIDDVIKAVCDGLGIDDRATASTLYRHPGMDHGIEADLSYYIANEPAVRGVEDEIDLSVYPPPDLMVEVVVTHPATKALAICRELGVPEVWVYRPRSRSLTFLHLSPDGGRYAPSPSSRAFPFLTPDDVLPWVEAPGDEPDRLWRERLRAWVRDTLAPRLREGGK